MASPPWPAPALCPRWRVYLSTLYVPSNASCQGSPTVTSPAKAPGPGSQCPSDTSQDPYLPLTEGIIPWLLASCIPRLESSRLFLLPLSLTPSCPPQITKSCPLPISHLCPHCPPWASPSTSPDWIGQRGLLLGVVCRPSGGMPAGLGNTEHFPQIGGASGPWQKQGPGRLL